EQAAFAKVFLLRLRPAAEGGIDGEELDLGEGVRMRLLDLGITRTIEIARGNLLALLGVPELQIGLGDLARALLVGNRIDDRKRRLGEDRQRRRDDLELVLAEFAQRQIRLVLPSEEAAADAR